MFFELNAMYYDIIRSHKDVLNAEGPFDQGNSFSYLWPAISTWTINTHLLPCLPRLPRSSGRSYWGQKKKGICPKGTIVFHLSSRQMKMSTNVCVSLRPSAAKKNNFCVLRALSSLLSCFDHPEPSIQQPATLSRISSYQVLTHFLAIPRSQNTKKTIPSTYWFFSQNKRSIL